jgi:hypothetical protein
MSTEAANPNDKRTDRGWTSWRKPLQRKDVMYR